MDDWVLALIGVSLLACICICGELATWVKEDDDKTKGFKKTTSKKTYMGAPMRMTFSGFDLPEKKRRAREMAHLDMPGLDLSGGHGMLPGATMADINLTPRDADGTPRLMSARELAESAHPHPPLRRCRSAATAANVVPLPRGVSGWVLCGATQSLKGSTSASVKRS
jgi:hypothetical protein